MSNSKMDWGTVLGTIALGMYSWIVANIVKKIFPFIVIKSEGIESDKYSKFIQLKEMPSEESISRRFEERCIINPLEYKDDEDILDCVDEYKDLIDGKIIDKGGYNVPSMTIGGVENPDYLRYLINQKKSHKKKGLDNSWIVKEIKRVNNKKAADNITIDFAGELVNKGMPVEFIMDVLTYYRIENYEPKDWDKLIKAVRTAYRTGSSNEGIRAYIEITEDPNMYQDFMIENFCILLEEDVPAKIAIEYATLRITGHQAKKAILLYSRGHNEEEALLRVLKEDSIERDTIDLIASYRNRL